MHHYVKTYKIAAVSSSSYIYIARRWYSNRKFSRGLSLMFTENCAQPPNTRLYEWMKTKVMCVGLSNRQKETIIFCFSDLKKSTHISNTKFCVLWEKVFGSLRQSPKRLYTVELFHVPRTIRRLAGMSQSKGTVNKFNWKKIDFVDISLLLFICAGNLNYWLSRFFFLLLHSLCCCTFGYLSVFDGCWMGQFLWRFCSIQ